MGTAEESVAKARIILVDDTAESSLMSRKNAHSKRNHGLLEMLGGHLEAGETPLAGLVRELREEERTGVLADHVLEMAPPYRVQIVDDTDHYLFEVRLPRSVFDVIAHDPEESLGFELVPMTQMLDGTRWETLTWRTQRILEAFGSVPTAN